MALTRLVRTLIGLAALGLLAAFVGNTRALAATSSASVAVPAGGARTAVCVLAILSVAGIAMVAMLAHVAGRLTDDRRIGWVSPLAALYGALAVPEVLGIEMISAPHLTGDVVLAVVALLAVVLGIVLGLTLAWAGRVDGNPTLSRIGPAVVVIALAHAHELCVTAPEHGLVFAVVRLGGVLVLLTGTVVGTHRAILDVDLGQSEQQEELRLAQLNLREAAERDHEVRNAVAGLAGAATLFGARPPADDTAALRTAMVAELARLDALLGGPARSGPHSTPYRVHPVLSQQVALRRSAGMEIELGVELGLGAVGSSTLLAQVLTNVLSNCATHAAGSPVRIDARRRDGRIQILVSDLGPGIAVEPGADVFEFGVRGARSAGHGFGLHICRRLLAEEGGTIAIRPRSVDQPGCTVELNLVAAEVTERPNQLAALRRVS